MRNKLYCFLFLFLCSAQVIAQPTISAITPASGVPGSSVTITGTNFNATPANNIVYFGATKAAVSAASTTSLTVTVPVGATCQDVTVNNAGTSLTGYSEYPFMPTYNNSLYMPGSVNFAPQVTFTTGNQPWGIVTGDIDGDGKPDVVVSNLGDNTISVYLNTSSSGAVSFAAPVTFAAGHYPGYIAIGDIDGDGKPDLAVPNELDNTVSVYRNTSSIGTVNFTTQVVFTTGSQPNSVVIGDIDGDGRPDMVVTNQSGNTISVFHNTGSSGTINFAAQVTFACGNSPWNITIGDIDGDGKPDLAVGNGSDNTISLYLNTSSTGVINFASQVTVTIGANTKNPAIIDLDGDGKADLAVPYGTLSGFVSILRNTGSIGTFNFAAPVTFSTDPYPYGISIADIDGDGKPDMTTVSDLNNTVSVLLNNSSIGTINFATEQTFATGNQAAGLTVGDIDGDGKPDVAVTNYSDHTISILRNSPLTISGAQFYNISGTDVSNLNNWGTSTDGSGAHPPNFTTPTTVFNLVNGAFATIGANWVITDATLNVGNGSSAINFTIPSTFSLTNMGASVVNVLANGTVTIQNNTYPMLGVLDNASTINNNASAIGQPVLPNTYGNLTLSNGAGNFAGGNVSVNGVLAFSGGSSLSIPGTTLTLNGTVSGMDLSDFIFTGGANTANLVIGATGPVGTLNFGIGNGFLNNFSMTGAGGSVIINDALEVGNSLSIAAGATLDMGANQITGGFTPSVSGTLKTAFTGNPVPSGLTWGGTFIYDGLTAQTIEPGTYNNLTISNGVISPTLAGNVTVNGDLHLSSHTKLDISGTTFTLNGTVSGMDANDYIVSSAFSTNMVIGSSGALGTLVFDVTNHYFSSFSINTSGGSAIIGSDMLVVGAVTVAAGATLDMSTSQLLSGTPFISGTVKTACTTTTPVPMATWGGTFIYDGSAAQTIAQGTYNNLTLSNGVTSVISGSVTASNNLTLSGNSIFDISGGTLTLNGTVSGMNATNHLAASSGSVVIGATGSIGSLSFGSGGGTVGTFSVTASGGSVTMISPMFVTGSLSVVSGATIDMTNNTLLGPFTPTMNGTFKTAYTGLGNPNTIGLSWGGTFIYNGAGVQTVVEGTYNNLTISNGANSSATGNVTVNGNLGLTGSSIFYTSGNTLTLNGTVSGMDANNYLQASSGTLSIGATGALGSLSFGSGGATYGILSMTGAGGSATVISPLFVTGSLSIVSGATLDMTNNALTGSFVPTMNGTFKTAYTGLGNPTTVGLTWGGTFIYDGAGVQNIVEGTYNNLTISNGANSGATGNITVNGNLALSGSSVFYPGTNTLTLNGTVSGMNATNYLSSSSATSLTIGATSALGTLYFDQTTPGTTNNYGTFTMNGTGGTATLGNALSITNTLALTAGTLDDGGNTITNTGNITGTGTHTGTGEILMTGASTTISGATLGNLELNNASGFSLSGSATVNGTLTLTTGSLSIGTNNLTFGSSAGAVAGALSPSKMIIANGTGSVYKQYTGPGSYFYPIGDNTPTYSPVSLTFGAGTYTGAAAGVNVTNAKHPQNANVTDYLNRYWTVTTSGIIPPTAIAATYVPSDVTGTEANISGGQYITSLPFLKFGATNTATHTVSAPSISAPVSAFTGISTASPSVTVTPTSINYCAGNFAVLTATGAGDPTLSYSWAPSTGLSSTTGAVVTVSTTVAATYVYTVTLTDGNGFTATATSTVVVSPAATPITGITNTCIDGTTMLFDGTAGGTWTSSAAGIASVGTDGTVTGGASGTTVITYSFSPICYATTTVSVIPAPTLLSATYTSACLGTTMVLHANNPVNVTGYSWSGPSSFSSTLQNPSIASASASADGIYTVTVNNGSGSGCTATYTTSLVSVNALPSAISGTGTMCTNATTTLTDPDAGGTWGSANTGIATVDPISGAVTGVTSGATVISFTITSTGCSATDVIFVYPSPASISGNLNVCYGLTSSLSDLTGGGTWSSTAPLTAGIGTSGVVTGSALGTATISYTLGTGCSTTAVVTVNPQPPTILGTLAVCQGLSTTLSDLSTGGTWASGNSLTAIAGSLSGNISGVAPGTVLITYTSNVGCTTTSVVTVNPVPAAIMGNTNICNGLTTSLSDTTPLGAWSSSSSGIASVVGGTVTGNSLGSATISYTLTTGCYATVLVSVNSQPTAINGNLSVCAGDATTNLSDNVTGGTWSSSDITIAPVSALFGVVTGFNPGTATITYTSSIGCITTAVVTVNPLPSAILGTMLVCPLANTSLSDASGSGNWTSGSTGVATIDPVSGMVTGVAAGTAMITFTNGNGCIATAIVTVAPLPAAITAGVQVCVNSSVTFSDSPAGGTWSTTSSGITLDPASGLVTGVSAGAADLTYTTTSGCIATGSVFVNPLPLPISGVQAVCVGFNSSLSDVLGGGTWTSSGAAGVITLGSSSGAVSGLSAGTANITYTLFTGCKITTVFTVNPLPSTIGGPLTVCVNSIINLTNTATGGTWSVDPSSTSFASIDASLGNVTGLAQGTASITYTLPTGCIATTIITVNPLPASITGTANVCVGLSTTLSDATAGGSWISGNAAYATIGTSGIVTGISAGSVGIIYQLPTGCISSITFVVNPLPTPIIGNRSICIHTTPVLSDGMTGGTWMASNPSISPIDNLSGSISGFSLGVDTITYTLPTGCSITTSVTVNPYPKAIAGDSVLCQGSSMYLSDSVTGGAWTSGDITRATVNSISGFVTGVGGGSLRITYTPTTGCYVTRSVTVNPIFPISGIPSVCAGSTTSLTDGTTGGTWSGGNALIATVGSSSGVVTGVASGNVILTYSLSTGCSVTIPVVVNPLPASFLVTGGGSFCASGSGVHIGLNGSVAGIRYTLFEGVMPIDTVYGNGSALDFGAVTGSGTYEVLATDTTTGCTKVMTGTATVASVSVVVPSVRIVALPDTTVCIGSPATLTALPVNGGSSPLYTWYVNNSIVASGAGATYFYVPDSGDVVKVKLTSDAICVAPDTAIATVTLHTAPLMTPSVTLTVGPSDSLCPGTPVTITPHPFNGGTPSYTWMKNGINVSSVAVYTFMPTNGDNVYCVMHSSLTCAFPTSVISANNINMTVPPIYVPIVSIAAHPGTRIHVGETDTLVSSVIFSGLSYTMQWKLNSTPIPGATTDTFISSALQSNDIVSCEVTGFSGCGSATNTGSVTIIDTIGVGVHQVYSGFADLMLVPNPNNGSFTITGTLPQGAAEDITARITDMLGRVTYEKVLHATNGKLNEQVQLDNTTASGMYILDLRSGDMNTVIHFVVGK